MSWCSVTTSTAQVQGHKAVTPSVLTVIREGTHITKTSSKTSVLERFCATLSTRLHECFYLPFTLHHFFCLSSLFLCSLISAWVTNVRERDVRHQGFWFSDYPDTWSIFSNTFSLRLSIHHHIRQGFWHPLWCSECMCCKGSDKDTPPQHWEHSIQHISAPQKLKYRISILPQFLHPFPPSLT